MSFWDNAFGATGSATPPPEPGHQRQQSLNEEVTEVMGQLGRFWGGFRKQSQDALEAARKEVGGYVEQAQKELTKLSAPTEATSPERSSRDITDGEASSSSSASASTSGSVSTLPGPSTSQSQTLFSRLQSTLPPDLITTLRDNLPETIRHAPEHLDLAQLRSTLQSVRVQDATARGEELLRGAGDFLRDAVRVVPPDEAVASSSSGGVVWDGSDFSAPRSGQDTPRSEAQDVGGRPSGEARAIATRKEALLRAVRSNADILKLDPAGEKSSEALFRAWCEKEVDAKEGGIGGAAFAERKASELLEDHQALAATQAALVPSHITEDEFWTRYFFRVYQIEQDDERRKALLEGSAEQEEDFSWEDEDEDATSPTASHDTHTVHTIRAADLADTSPAGSSPVEAGHLKAPSSQAATPGTMSPSQSEDSYDLVSSGHTSNTGEGKASKQKAEAEADEDEDSADSDWE